MDNLCLQKKSKIILFLLLCSCLFWLLGANMAQAGTHPRAIAHAGGAVQGDTVTNSNDAVEQAIANGYQ